MENHIGAQIKALRNERKLKQEDVAKGIGITRGAISLIETGASNPKMNTINKIAKFFNIEASFLFTNVNSTNIVNTKSNITLNGNDNIDDLLSRLLEKNERLVEANLYLTELLAKPSASEWSNCLI